MNRLNVFIDLDNTIINALTPKEVSLIPTRYNKLLEYKDMRSYYRVYERPYLEYFLDFLFTNFNVSVWTAAQSDYAIFILNNFILTKPNRKVEYIFHSYHVDLARQMYGEDKIKDLRLLWNYFELPNVYPCNTFIIDDLPDVLSTNPSNTINVEAWNVLEKGHFNVECLADEELLRVKGELERLKAQYEDVICPMVESSVASLFSFPYLIKQ